MAMDLYSIAVDTIKGTRVCPNDVIFQAGADKIIDLALSGKHLRCQTAPQASQKWRILDYLEGTPLGWALLIKFKKIENWKLKLKIENWKLKIEN